MSSSERRQDSGLRDVLDYLKDRSEDVPRARLVVQWLVEIFRTSSVELDDERLEEMIDDVFGKPTGEQDDASEDSPT